MVSEGKIGAYLGSTKIKSKLFAILGAAALFLCPHVLHAAVTLSPIAGSTPQHTRALAFFPSPIGVVARNDDGSAAPGIVVTFNLPVAPVSGSVPNQGSNITVVTDAAGQAMLPVPGLIAGEIAGTFTLQVNSAGAVNAAIFTLTIDAGRPTTLAVVSGSNQTALINTQYAERFVVRALGADGLPVPYAAIQWIAPASGGASGTFGGGNATPYIPADSNGVATSPAFVANGTVGSGNVLAFGATPLSSAVATTSFYFTNIAPVPPGPGLRRWTGSGTNDLWSTAANWEGAVVPRAGDRLLFPESPRNQSQNDVSAGPFESVRFETQHYLTGFPLSLTGATPITGRGGSIAMPVGLDHPNPVIESLGGGGTLSIGPGNIVIGGALDLRTAGDLILGGNIVETRPSSITMGVAAGGRGDVYLRGRNGISGNVAVNGVRLGLMTAYGEELGSTSSGTVFDNGAVLDVYTDSGEVAIREPIEFRGFTTAVGLAHVALWGPGPVTFWGPLTLNDGGKTILSFVDVVFHGAIGGNAALSLGGRSIKTLMNPANSFTGGLTVVGTLRNGASEVIPDGGDLVFFEAFENPAKYDLGPHRETVRSINCDGVFSVKLGQGQLKVRQASRLANWNYCKFEFTADAGLVPGPSDVITVIVNESGVPFAGYFRDLPEGAIVMVNGARMRATYLSNGYNFALVGVGAQAPAVSLAMVSGDPQTLHVSMVSPWPFVVRALDAAGLPVAGATVLFTVEGTCGTFGGQGTLQTTSDPSGLATANGFVSQMFPRQCTVRASLPGTQASQTFRVTTFDSSGVSLVATPAALTTQAGQAFSFTVSAQSGGVPIPGITIELAARSSGAANVASMPSQMGTSMSGDATVVATANSSPGQYEIEARAYNATLRIPVDQKGNTTPNPPTPPTAPSRRVTTTAFNGAPLTLAMGTADQACMFSEVSAADARLVHPQPPEGVFLPNGLVRISTTNCPIGGQMHFHFETPVAVGARFWILGRTVDNPVAHWHSVPVTIEGNRAWVAIRDGAYGDDDLIANGAVTVLGGISLQAAAAVSYQDLWWSGVEENGWGMSIIQHRDILFATVYIYDEQGRPTWLVIPGGAWNAARTAFTGDLYIPRGSPFFAYDVSRFDIGPRLGTGTFTFTDANTGTFDYSVNGVTGRKSIRRMDFGRAESVPAASVGELWWGGESQNGWGITVLQQLRTLFSVWFTYDAAGSPTWYVMPGGEWTTPDVYEGRMYRAEGPAWIGRPYDVSRHRTIDVGTFRLRFTGGTATLDYTIDGRSGSVPLTRLAF